MALLLLPALPCRAEDEAVPAPISCGKDTVVLFGGNESPDGRYALGWTIRPVKKDASPVDWSGYAKKGIEWALDHDADNGLDPDPNASYAVFDGVVDLTTKTFRELPLSRTYFTNSTHGWDISAQWLGRNEAIVVVDSRFWTSDLLLVRIGRDGLSATGLLPKANQQVGKLTAEKRPLAGDLEIMYDNGGKVVVRDGLIQLGFSAWHPKGSQEDLEGTLFLREKDGSPMRAECSAGTPEDRPFTGDLGSADDSLNEVYGSLRKSLKDGERAKLMADQREWIILRNREARAAAEEKVPFYDEDSTRDAYLAIRNSEALKITRERVETLQKQLVAIRN